MCLSFIVSWDCVVISALLLGVAGVVGVVGVVGAVVFAVDVLFPVVVLGGYV